MQEKQVPRWQLDVDMTLNGLASIPRPQLFSNAVRAHHLGESGPSLREPSGLQISRRVG